MIKSNDIRDMVFLKKNDSRYSIYWCPFSAHQL